MPQQTVTTTAAVILREDAGRKAMLFRHRGTSGTIFLSSDPPSSSQQSTAFWSLNGGDAVAFSVKGPRGDRVTRAVYAFSSSGSITLLYDELSGDETVFDIAFLAGGQQITQATQAFEVGGVAENTQGLAGKGPFVIQRDHFSEELVVMDAVSVPSGNVGTHNGVDISGYDKVSLNVKTTGAATVYYQLSDDNVNWYDPVTVADAAISYAVNNISRNIPVDRNGKYLRVVFNNTAGAANVCTAVIQGQA